MKDKLEERLNELKSEFENGRKVLEELDVKRANLTQTLLRISGAVQALEDLMPKEEVSN
jgi:predicted nuclease with TOPRIM domain